MIELNPPALFTSVSVKIDAEDLDALRVSQTKDRANMLSNYRNDLLQKFTMVDIDAQMDVRIESQVCEACHYVPSTKLLTDMPTGQCAGCMTEVFNEALLCKPCGVERSTCTMCGGDDNLIR